MPRRTSSLFVAAALLLALGPACANKQQLTEVTVPDEGIGLRYDVSPGQEYAGHVRMRNSLQTPMGDVVTVLEFDVALAVSGKQIGDAMLVRATVENIELQLRMPDGIPAAAAGGMSPEAAAALNGMELRFNLDARGDIDDVPEPPDNAAPGIKGIIGMITSALTGGLALRMPEQPLEAGQSWDAKSEDSPEGVKSASSTGRLEGLARNEAGEDIAQLVYAATVEAERVRDEQTMQIKQTIDTKASFSASGGYPVRIERKINNEIVGQGTILSEIDGEWSKGAKQDVPLTQEPVPADVTEVQAIDDPCDPDYVGAGECVEEAAPPATEAAPPATEAAKSSSEASENGVER